MTCLGVFYFYSPIDQKIVLGGKFFDVMSDEHILTKVLQLRETSNFNIVM